MATNSPRKPESGKPSYLALMAFIDEGEISTGMEREASWLREMVRRQLGAKLDDLLREVEAYNRARRRDEIDPFAAFFTGRIEDEVIHHCNASLDPEDDAGHHIGRELLRLPLSGRKRLNNRLAARLIREEELRTRAAREAEREASRIAEAEANRIRREKAYAVLRERERESRIARLEAERAEAQRAAERIRPYQEEFEERERFQINSFLSQYAASPSTHHLVSYPPDFIDMVPHRINDRIYVLIPKADRQTLATIPPLQECRDKHDYPSRRIWQDLHPHVFHQQDMLGKRLIEGPRVETRFTDNFEGIEGRAS